MRTHAIFGYGVVGKALHDVLLETREEIRIFDPARPDLESLHEASKASIWWVCVPTDGQWNGRLDLTRVEGIVALAALQPHTPLVIVKSTLGLGAIPRFGQHYDRWAFSPEFLVESAPSMRNPSRLVVGAATSHVLNESVVVCAAVPAWKNAPLVQCSAGEAILIKLASNAMLAAKVEIANELYDLCEREGLSYDTVRLGISLDKRIGGAHLLVPGPDGRRGFGGKCLPKDTAELAAMGLDVFRAVSDANRLRRGAAEPISTRSRAAE